MTLKWMYCCGILTTLSHPGDTTPMVFNHWVKREKKNLVFHLDNKIMIKN